MISLTNYDSVEVAVRSLKFIQILYIIYILYIYIDVLPYKHFAGHPSSAPHLMLILLPLSMGVPGWIPDQTLRGPF